MGRRKREETSAASPYEQMRFDFSTGTIIGTEIKKETDKPKASTQAYRTSKTMQPAKEPEQPKFAPYFKEILMSAAPENKLLIEGVLFEYGMYSSETLKTFQKVYTGTVIETASYRLTVPKPGIGPIIHEITKNGSYDVPGMWHPMISCANELVKQGRWMTDEERTMAQRSEQEATG